MTMHFNLVQDANAIVEKYNGEMDAYRKFVMCSHIVKSPNRAHVGNISVPILVPFCHHLMRREGKAH